MNYLFMNLFIKFNEFSTAYAHNEIIFPDSGFHVESGGNFLDRQRPLRTNHGRRVKSSPENGK